MPKRVLITGGARRVGAALCRRFAAAGYEVIIHCNRAQAEAELLAAELAAETGLIHRVVNADLLNTDAPERIFAAAGGHVDCLVNNAAIFSRFSGIMAENPAAAERFMRINYFAPLELMRIFARQAVGDGGAIVNMLDQEVLRATPRGGSYAAAKRALYGATLEFAAEMAPRIRVNAVAPGPVLPPEWCPDSRMERTLPGVPLGRAVAVDDLTAAVLFLAENCSLTGAVLPVDCGQHLR